MIGLGFPTLKALMPVADSSIATMAPQPDRAGRGLPDPAKAMGGLGLWNDFALR